MQELCLIGCYSNEDLSEALRDMRVIKIYVPNSPRKSLSNGITCNIYSVSARFNIRLLQYKKSSDPRHHFYRCSPINNSFCPLWRIYNGMFLHRIEARPGRMIDVSGATVNLKLVLVVTPLIID